MNQIRLTLLTVLISMTVACSQTQEEKSTNGNKVILNSDVNSKNAEPKNDTLEVKSSDCSNWIKTTSDKVTGTTYDGVINFINVLNEVEDNGFLIAMTTFGADRVIVLTINAYGGGNCIDEKDAVNILFTDGSRMALKIDSNFNCDAKATVYFGGVFGREKQLEELKTKKIETLRVQTSDESVTKDFTTENQEEFYIVINCLSKS